MFLPQLSRQFVLKRTVKAQGSWRAPGGGLVAGGLLAYGYDGGVKGKPRDDGSVEEKPKAS